MSMLKRRRLPDLKAKIPVLPAMESRYISQCPFLLGAVAACKSGKTYTSLSLVNLMRKEGTCSKLYVICPTVKSNSGYQAVLRDGDRIYDDLDRVYEALAEIQQDCVNEVENYRRQLEAQAAYNKYVNGDALDAAEQNLVEEFAWQGKVIAKRPCPILIIDDCSHSKIMSTGRRNPLMNLALRFRHVGDTENLGLSIIVITQTWSGIPKAIRSNLTHCMLWRTENIKEQKRIYEEIASFTDWDTFQDIFKDFTEAIHSYLFIDSVQKALLPSF